jgi:hypothetical protein
MEFFTLDRQFRKQEIIDVFESAIWTERYYGDGEFQIVVPATNTMMERLPKNQFMLLDGSDQPMIIEHREIKDGLLKVTGISLTKWLNNRFFNFAVFAQGPTSPATRPWTLSREYAFEMSPTNQYGAGVYISYWFLLFCTDGGGETTGNPPQPLSYLTMTNGPASLGISDADAERLVLPNCVLPVPVLETDPDGEPVTGHVSFTLGPWYDSMRPFAVAWEIGMKLLLDYANGNAGEAGSDYQLSFHTYRGEDRTSNQSENQKVQFSSEMNSFINITDLESVTDHRNIVWVRSTDQIGYLPADIMAGKAESDPTAEGFDLKAYNGYEDGLYTDSITQANLDSLETNRAKQILGDLRAVNLVDGEAVQIPGVEYGVDFFLGDIIEVKGNTEVLQTARITEFIRSEDSTGERAFPTLAMIDE